MRSRKSKRRQAGRIKYDLKAGYLRLAREGILRARLEMRNAESIIAYYQQPDKSQRVGNSPSLFSNIFDWSLNKYGVHITVLALFVLFAIVFVSSFLLIALLSKG